MTDRFQLHVVGVDRVFSCRPEESVLNALAPIHRLKIDSGCRGGGCGVCKVRIVAGACERGKMSAAHVGDADEAVALACRVYPRTDMTIAILERRVLRFG